MKVFLSGTSFAPSYGGPAVSVSRLAVEMGKAGVEVGVWSPDGSALTSVLICDEKSVTTLGGSLNEALQAFERADIIHDNGLWLRHNHQLAVAAEGAGIPRIVSTRGMLEPWAIRHKRPKKKIAWSLYQKRDLGASACLHATSEVEAGNLAKLGLNRPIKVIANGVELPQLNGEMRPVGTNRGKSRVAVFVGRIYPVKGLPLLIEAWKTVRPANWRLVIAGPDEAGHLEEVKAAVKSAGLESVVSFPGAVQGNAKRELLTSSDLFVLPTHSESFGMAVAEAMSYGLPVLTTTAAPWPALESKRSGWRVNPDAESIAHALKNATSLNSATLAEMGERGREIIFRDYRWKEIVRQFIAMYEQAMSAGKTFT